MNAQFELGCEAVDELAAAFALGAVDVDEGRAVTAHLETCERDHIDANSLIGAGMAVAASLDPVVPSDRLRTRLMTTIAATAQDHVAAPVTLHVPGLEKTPPGRRWWQLAPLPSALAAIGLAAAVGLGAWGMNLREELADRDAALAAVSSAEAVHSISGEAGSALILESGDSATFLAEELADLPAGTLYHFWLIDPDGKPVPAGTLEETDGVALVELDRGLGDATTFAVTRERGPVEAPTSAPIMAGELDT